MAWAILARISGLDPSSAMIAPRYLNLLTQSSFSPLTLMSVLKPLVLLVISLIFSALICMPKAVEVLSRRSTKSASYLLFPSCQAVYVVCKTQVCNISATNADCPLSYSDGGSEPVPYAVVKGGRAGGLVYRNMCSWDVFRLGD